MVSHQPQIFKRRHPSTCNPRKYLHRQFAVRREPLAYISYSEIHFLDAVFLNIGANDGCKPVGTASFVDHKTRFYPGELSSLRGGTTYSYDFADIPCPPESVHPHQSEPYRPQIAFPSFMTDLDPAWKTCTSGPNEGHDPFTPLKKAKPTGVSDFKKCGAFGVGVGCKHRREA